MLPSRRSIQRIPFSCGKFRAARELDGIEYNGAFSLKVHIPDTWVLRILILVISDVVVKALGKYMRMEYLDP